MVKEVMVNKDFSALMLIVDCSGSMSSIWEEAESSMNNLLKEQRELPGKLSIKMVEFNERVKSKKLVDSSKFGEWKMFPSGFTALYDAIGIGIDELGKELAELTEDERPASVIVAIVTDGHENTSQEYTGEMIKEMINNQKAVFNWEFIFLGANQDAISTAQGFGIGKNSAMTFGANSAGVTNSVAATSRYLSETRSGLEASFTDDDRDKSMG